MSEKTHNMVSEKQTILPVVQALQHSFGSQLVAIVLFGSRARGEASEGSDWDLLLIAYQLPHTPFQRHLLIKKMLPAAWRGAVAIIAKTPIEFESYLPELYLDIALDGIVIYDTDVYMGDRLARLRRLIKRKGLQRERKQQDFIWHWREFPGYDWSIEWGTAV